MKIGIKNTLTLLDTVDYSLLLVGFTAGMWTTAVVLVWFLWDTLCV